MEDVGLTFAWACEHVKASPHCLHWVSAFCRQRKQRPILLDSQQSLGWSHNVLMYNDKKENKIVLIYKEIEMGSGAMSYMRRSFPIYEELCKYLTMFEDAGSHICTRSSEFPYI
jgi:hypothetical protein